MKILITAAQFSSKMSGLQRHAFNMVHCLLQQNEVAEVHLVLAPWQHEMFCAAGLEGSARVKPHVVDMNQGVLSRNLWYFRSLPKLVAQIQPDILHLSYPVPINASAIACPRVLTLHDLYPYEIPENFGFPKVWVNRLILQQCLRSVDVIACVSDATLRTLKRYAQPSVWHKSLLIPNCIEAETRCTEESPIPAWEGEPFLLTVSQHRRNKNIPLLVRSLHRLLQQHAVPSQTKLVIVGIPGPETEEIERLVSELQLGTHVVFLQGLSDAALQWCYRHCEVMAAPSETEGFGLPVAEALLAGCRVVCSDIPAFREIGQPSCLFVAMGEGSELRWTQALVESLQKPRPAPIALPQFSSQVLGAKYVHTYRGLLPHNTWAAAHCREEAFSVATVEGRPL